MTRHRLRKAREECYPLYDPHVPSDPVAASHKAEGLGSLLLRLKHGTITTRQSAGLAKAVWPRWIGGDGRRTVLCFENGEAVDTAVPWDGDYEAAWHQTRDWIRDTLAQGVAVAVGPFEPAGEGVERMMSFIPMPEA